MWCDLYGGCYRNAGLVRRTIVLGLFYRVAPTASLSPPSPSPFSSSFSSSSLSPSPVVLLPDVGCFYSLLFISMCSVMASVLLFLICL